MLERTHGPVFAWVVAAEEPHRSPDRGQHGDRAESRQDDGSKQLHARSLVALRGWGYVGISYPRRSARERPLA